MLVNRLQRHLESIYEVRSGYRVADFLIDDAALARRLDTTANARDIRFDERLSEAERHRYRSANYFAGRFCSWVEREFLRPGARSGLVNTLRRFYRLTQQRKITAIRHLQGAPSPDR